MIFMKIWGFVTAFLIFAFFSYIKVDASEMMEQSTEYTVESEVQNDDLDIQKNSEIVEYSFEFNEPVETFTITPVPVYEVNPDDYNGGMISAFAMNVDVYNGSYNSTVLTLWNGLLSNNIGKEYVAYRASQYEYYIWFGENFVASDNTFSGSGTYYCLNTYNSTYYLTTGSDSFTIDAGQNYLYTNVSAGYPALETERGLLYEQIQTTLLAALLFICIFKWILSSH